MRNFRKYKCPMRNKHNGLKYFGCCLLLCASMFLTACGGDGTAGGGNNVPDESDPASVVQEQKQELKQEPEREWVYVPEVIKVGAGYADYAQMQPMGDTFCYVLQGGDIEDGEKNICRYSLTDRELKSVPVRWPEGGSNWDRGVWVFAQDQNLYMTANVYPADYSRMTRFLCKFDAEGNCLFSQDITEQAGRDVSLDRLTIDGQGRLYLFTDNGDILLYSGEGEYHGSVSYSSPESLVPARVKGACDGADGRYYVCIGKEKLDISGENANGGDAGCSLLEIDFEGVKLMEIAGNLPDVNGICAGKRRGGDSAGQSDDTAGKEEDAAGQYDFLLYDDRAVYGYDLSSKKGGSGSAGEELFAWMDSDINGYCVTNLYLLEDGRLCAAVDDWRNDDEAIVALTRTKADEVPQREDLVLVTVDGESDLAAMAVKFNRGNSRYHLTVKSYESLTDLYNAVLTKEPMDLVDLSGINVQKLTSQGFFEDLTPYVEQSAAISRSDFVDGIFDVYTFDNILIGIPAAFTLRTVVGNGTQLENKAGLTLDELLAAGERYPGVQTFNRVTKEDMMQYIMMFNEDAFVDWENGVCHFDSESFEAVLEYVNRFPDSLENRKDEASLPTKIQNGEVLFAIGEMTALDAFQDFEGMFGEDAACVGFPTADGRGGHLLFTSDAYAIAAVSEHKEGAWQCLEDFLTEEKSDLYYKSPDNYFVTSFPTLKKKLNEKVESAMEAGSQIPANRFPIHIYDDGYEIQTHALTWDEVNVILNLVPDATPFFSVEGDEIIKIISEEAQAYYSGQKRAEDVAGIIQNRAQLYVDEQK